MEKLSGLLPEPRQLYLLSYIDNETFDLSLINFKAREITSCEFLALVLVSQ
jgi:hypothetical protein